MNPSIKDIQHCVQAALEETNTFILDQLTCDIPLTREVGEHLINSGGKRARPLLVLLVTAALNYTGGEHIPLATTIEFIHTASLLHDDVIDESDLRRGKPTANKVWGNKASILAGDFIYSRASQLTARLNNNAINLLLTETSNQLAQGEILQLIHANNFDITQEQYFETIRRKTAYLFAAAAKSAAILAGASKEQQEALYQYGLHLGLAFQLMDDLLDYNGDSDILGKTVGHDLSEGKLTLPLILALQQASPSDAVLIRESLQAKNITKLPEILTILKTTGALVATQETAKRHVREAISALDALPASTYRNALVDLAQFTVTRAH